MASKYDALRDHLQRQQGEVYLSFEEIEDILGLELPSSSRRKDWWANSRSALNRAQRHAWGDAGYLAKPVAHGVVFRKIKAHHTECMDDQTPSKQMNHDGFSKWL